LANGWYATMYDNAKGTIRMADVEGFCREIGSVYAHDIKRVQVDGAWVDVTHTPAQVKLRATVAAAF
jgi:hypothetical protein